MLMREYMRKTFITDVVDLKELCCVNTYEQ